MWQFNTKALKLDVICFATHVCLPCSHHRVLICTKILCLDKWVQMLGELLGEHALVFLMLLLKLHVLLRC